ncbi:hypothetical protein PVAP13_5KG385607 [Panicum virgatum]|uniref:Uncharacterized protein n=1 Tax=Panicum virgatum TaxID=38727 RepID=A0A8T0SRW6_PANVG|nr:hypothetical protein PVAP13_5KG385607 [Panicum virgatum]
MFFTWSSSRSTPAIYQQAWFLFYLLYMAEWCLRRQQSRWPVWFAGIGRFVSVGWVVHLLILLGNIWRTSELRILIFSLRTSCFQRRVEMLWTLLLASSTNAGARSSRWLDQDLVAE